jgi:hypothetical protein
MPKPAFVHSVARRSFAVVLVASFVVYGSTVPNILAAQAAQAGDLRIAVIQGEDGVNIIQQRTATPTIVEVRDRNNLPVAGASVLFLLGGGGRTASLNNGATQVTLTTNAAGRAQVTVNPLTNGQVQLQVRATYQGQTATTTINQTNFQTAAQAAQAGAGASNAATAAGAAAGAGAAGATAAGGSTGGGLSTAAIAGIAGGAAVGGIVAVKKLTANKPPTINGQVTATATTALLGLNSAITFSVDATDPDSGDTLTFTWDFGDGATDTGSGKQATHSYTTAGTFTVKVTVSDGKESVSGQTASPVTVKSLAASWRSNAIQSQAGTLGMVFALTQSGNSLTGTFTQGSGTGPITNGSIKASQPQVTFTVTPSIGTTTFPPFTFTGNLSADYNTITGVLNGSGYIDEPITIVRQ